MNPTAAGANPYAPPKAPVSDVAEGAQPILIAVTIGIVIGLARA